MTRGRARENMSGYEIDKRCLTFLLRNIGFETKNCKATDEWLDQPR